MLASYPAGDTIKRHTVVRYGAMKAWAFLLASALALAHAASPASWKDGKLLDLTVAMTALPSGKPAPLKVYTFSVDGSDKIYEAQETSRKAPHVEVNSPIPYSITSDHLYIRDADGKVHKLSLTKTTRKE